MKGNFSRDNYQPRDRYSGVFPVQGGMVTDANLREQAQIARGRTDQLGHDTSGSGVPISDGAVTITGSGSSSSSSTPALAEGVLYAEGVRGYTEATGVLVDELSLYGQQVDFPLAPPLPENGIWFLFAFVCQRTVATFEDQIF
jgi:hypothetical protein